MVGELVQTTDGKWIARPPTHCPSGHQLGPDQSSLATSRALATVVAGIRAGIAELAIPVAYGPPVNTRWTGMDGRAAVRISTARD